MTDPTESPRFELSVKPETLRLCFFISFWVMSLILIALTAVFNPHSIHHNAILEWSGGIYNLCIFYDHPPATYVAPFLWSICLVILVAYLCLSLFEVNSLYKRQRISRAFYTRRAIYCVVLAFSGCFFSTIFAVQPEDNLMVHALPFLGIILTLTLLALNNVLFYSRLGLSPGMRRYARGYGVALGLVTTLYLFNLFNSLVLGIESLYLFNFIGKVGTQALDAGWLVLVSVFPIAHSAYLRKRISEPTTIRLS